MSPDLEGLLAIEQDYLETRVLFYSIKASRTDAIGFHGRPLLCQCFIQAPCSVHDHGAWSSTVYGTNESWRVYLAVVVGDKRKSSYLAI